MSDIKATLDSCAQQLTGPGAPWEVNPETINGVDYRTYTQAPKSLKELVDAGRVHGDKDFLIYENERLTFTEFFAKADALAYQLNTQFGVKKGDRIAIAMRNYPEWMIAFVAIASVGAVVVPLNSWGQTKELQYGLEDSGSSLLICDEQRYRFIDDQLENLNVKAIVARTEGASLGPHACDFDTLVNQAEGKAPQAIEISSDDTAMIMYTSGTTGNPKGAVSNQRNICQSIYNFEFAGICAAMANPETIGKMLEKGFEPKVLLAVPLFHVSGCHSVFLLSLRGGRPIVMMYKWDTEKALQLIEKERITMISAVPTMLWDLMQSPLFKEYDTKSLFSVGAGGAAQPPLLPDLIAKQVPDSFAGTGYGLTESNAAGFAATGNSYQYKPRSVGTITPIVDVKICDEDGNEVAQGEAGEIFLRSPTVVQGYWNKPEANAETFKDNWLITGDVGYLDDEGYLFLTDRIKDMIIRGGENIYSAEIESCILGRDDIMETAAFGVPHETLGEELAVVVYTKAGTELSVADIQAHVKSELAGFKVPSHVFFVNEALPKNPSGKVLKKELRSHYTAQLGQ
jgi:acyl-CoA synthetase (AMP-forming)/AMP-acid ligase II